MIADNANTLFYNSPIITEYNNTEYLSYLQNDGKVIVARLDKNYNVIEKTIVHDYGDRAFRKNLVKNGFADDHAAPAIIYDKKLDTMWLATCYHGSELYIYRFDKLNNKFQKYKVLNGFFTYPRFISYEDNIVLFVREQVGSKRRTGNLVKFDSKNKFNNKEIVKKSIDNKVIYASRPFLSNDEVYFTYGYHDYEKKYIDGWYVFSYNLNENKVTDEKNLTEYTKGFKGNRPTAIAVKDKNILVGTSLFKDYDEKNFVLKEPNFEIDNTVKLLMINNNGDIKLVREEIVKAPYYGTDVFIDSEFNYIFFDRNKMITNKRAEKNDFDYKMYPYLYKKSLFYVVPKSKYKIREFNTDLYIVKDFIK